MQKKCPVVTKIIKLIEDINVDVDSFVFRLHFSKYVIEALFGAKMKIFKSPDQHHNVIITVGSDATEIIENTFKSLKRRII